LQQHAIKILCTVTNDLNHDQRMQRICSCLMDLGYEVTLIGRETKFSEPLLPQSFQQKRLKCFINKGFLFYAEYNIRLFFLLLFTTFNIVCSVDLDTLSAGIFAAKIKRKKCVYDAHEYFPESAELVGRPKIQTVWEQIEKFLLPKADAIYTVSGGIQKIFEIKYLLRVYVVRNLPKYYSLPQNPTKGNYIIYQGALNIGRGLETMINIMPKIDAELWLAGEGDISEELKQMALKIAPEKIKFLGRIPPEELKSITQNALLGINLLEPIGESYYRSLCNKFFDYMMAEIPQICIDFPEYHDLNKHYHFAHLIEEVEESSLENAIQLILINNEYRNSLIENCKKAKKELCWEKEIHQLEVIYRSLE
jgi:glycosyltransferase involved in cell wall biosynthesis